MTVVTLASMSATRAELLRRAGLNIHIQHPGVDEEAVKAGLLAVEVKPRDIADALAEAKAMKVSRQKVGLVIGADSTLELEGLLYDKPRDLAEAREHLLALRGKRHKLHSAVVIADAGQPIWRHVATSILTVRSFSDAFLDNYLAAEGDALLSSVGCYRLEGLGAQLFSAIEGDYFAILGLPLLPVLDFLRIRGIIAS
jgi:septum formation protein